jgi:tRNA 2-(methylsulfanyl)-N6-isopentenyladenosine37 hydroxylase
MLHLRLPTDPRWVRLVEEDLHAAMVDHAWCEHKAASNAMSIMVRFPEDIALVQVLAGIAREELEHFAQVVERIHARGWQLTPERKDHYVNDLLGFARKDGARIDRLVDRLLFSAMIEARSCERFKVLQQHVQDKDLASFYHHLMESEAGHYATFIALARSAAPRMDVDARWRAFLDYEALVVGNYGKQATIHG